MCVINPSCHLPLDPPPRTSYRPSPQLPSSSHPGHITLQCVRGPVGPLPSALSPSTHPISWCHSAIRLLSTNKRFFRQPKEVTEVQKHCFLSQLNIFHFCNILPSIIKKSYERQGCKLQLELYMTCAVFSYETMLTCLFVFKHFEAWSAALWPSLSCFLVTRVIIFGQEGGAWDDMLIGSDCQPRTHCGGDLSITW